MRWMRLLCLSVLVSAAPPAATAYGQVDFSHLVTFGDSMTANDILWIFFHEYRALYGNDPAEAVFLKAARPGDKLSNFAIPGTPSSRIEWQINVYERLRNQGHTPPATLMSFQIGGEDLLDNIHLLAAAMPGVDPKADAVITQLIANIVDAVNRLTTTDPDSRLVVWTVGDLTLVPHFFGKFSEEEVTNIRAHTERANRVIRSLEIPNRLLIVDTYRFEQDIIASPPVIAGFEIVGPPSFGKPWGLFADSIHLTGVANEFFANFIIRAINESWSDEIPQYTESELAQMARILQGVGTHSTGRPLTRELTGRGDGRD